MNCSASGCGEPIRRGERYVAINRNVERVEPGPGNVTMVDEGQRLRAYHMPCAPEAGGEPDADVGPRRSLRLFAAVLSATCAAVALTTPDAFTRVMFAIAAVLLPAAIEWRIRTSRRGRE